MSLDPTGTGGRGTHPRRTALYDLHVALGARLVEFGGWQMPVRYSGIIAEHAAVRHAAGLFDLSHMGELWVGGREAAHALSGALVSDPARLAVGRAQYSLLCAPDGGVIDDLIVYRTAQTRFLVVPNAANAATVADELRSRLAGQDASVDDATLRTSLVAIQGPAAGATLAPLTDVDLAGLATYAIRAGSVAGMPAHVARTGYTGEDGFELFVAWDDGPRVWSALMAADPSPLPCGLGARDTLRLEAGMPLYGNELTRNVTPFEAGLGRIVRFGGATDFVGRVALESAAAATGRRVLVGLMMRGPGIARHGHLVHAQDGAGESIGIVTSGSHSPTLGSSIAMAFVPPDTAAAGTMLSVAVREAMVPAEVVRLPFYQRERARDREDSA